jgi:hypothetical protein
MRVHGGGFGKNGKVIINGICVMLNKLKSYINLWNIQKIGSNKFVNSSDIDLQNKSKTSDETLLRAKKILGDRAQELLEQAIEAARARDWDLAVTKIEGAIKISRRKARKILRYILSQYLVENAVVKANRFINDVKDSRNFADVFIIRCKIVHACKCKQLPSKLRGKCIICGGQGLTHEDVSIGSVLLCSQCKQRLRDIGFFNIELVDILINLVSSCGCGGCGKRFYLTSEGRTRPEPYTIKLQGLGTFYLCSDCYYRMWPEFLNEQEKKIHHFAFQDRSSHPLRKVEQQLLEALKCNTDNEQARTCLQDVRNTMRIFDLDLS